MEKTLEKIELKIEGMHCISCERTITQALRKVPEVKYVAVSFVSNEALVERTQGFDKEDLIKAIQSTGYNAFFLKGTTDNEIALSEEKNFKTQLILVIIGSVLTLPLIFHMIVELSKGHGWIPLWLQFTLATLVQFGLGWRFYVGSYYALKNLAGNMDLLICLGTSAAYFYSTVVYLFSLRLHVYFESSAAIITLILLGRLLELKTKKKASGAIKELLKLQPKRVRVKREESWQEVPIEEIKIGDLFQVRPGEKIPVDGNVIDGSSYVDESMLTGESAPVKKMTSLKVFAGTQNIQGSFICRATAIGSETALASIIELVKQAQKTQAPVQKLADKISAVFVPVVLLISLITLFSWWAATKDFSPSLINAVAVLVIACPCALGMATPTVIMVASGKGAQCGILIKNAEALQKAEKIELLAVDKTGTLTEGKPKLTHIIPPDIIRLVASLEDHSEHPIGKTIAASYSGEKAPVLAFETVPGSGVQGTIEGKKYYVGSLNWMEKRGLGIDKNVTDPLEREGKTVVLFSDERHILGYLALADTLKQNSQKAIERLKDYGIDVVMLTGDHKNTAKAIAKQAGISTFYAEVLPQDKSHMIERLKKGNKLIAMVGDGINDAPALAAADIGFAMSSGTDVAIEASDITLMKNDMMHVADAIDLSKATFKKVRQNLFFAFIYNILGIPLAALGFLNPVIAGAAMALSSLCVVINSLLLNRWMPKT